MKKYLTLILFALITTLAFSQNNYQDVVYLKNGSIIRGIIKEQVPNKSIKIETADKSVFVYQMDEIEKLTKEPIKVKSRNSSNNIDFQPSNNGIAEFGYQIGTGDYGMDRMKLDFINSYNINPNFSIGIGTGVRYYFDAEAALVPVFADFRVNFKDNIDSNVSPYLSFDLGYTFDATDGFEGVGLLLNPTVGVSFTSSNNTNMKVGLGYEMQKMKAYNISYDYYDYYIYEDSVNSGAISIIVGISF